MKPIVRNLNAVYPNSADSEKQRYRAVEVGFAEHFGELGEHRFFSVPARTEICGNHTDHNNGKVVAASINRDVIAVAEQTNDGFVTVKSEGFPEDKIDISDLEPREDEKNTSAALIRGILMGFKKNGHNIGGFRAYTSSGIIRGSGLASSAAFEVLIGTILSHMYNDGQITPAKTAQIAHTAETEYFGKHSGLMDQTACAVGGFVAIDMKDGDIPVIEHIKCDFDAYQHALCIVDTKSEHSDLTGKYSEIYNEMSEIAGFFDCKTLRSLSLADIMLNIRFLREKFGDRAVLRAIHFFHENERVEKVVHALKNDMFENFLMSVRESGDSSFKYLQNVYSNSDIRHQSLSIALNVAESTLHRKGACRVHGGGFAGTIQAFVPFDLLKQFKMNMEKIFGTGACHILSIRGIGACEVILE